MANSAGAVRGKAAVAEQQAKLLAALRAARESGPYPLTVSDLATRAEISEEAAVKLVLAKDFRAEILVAKGKRELAPVVLRPDASLLAESELLLLFAAREARAKREQKGTSLTARPDKLYTDAGLEKELKPRFLAALDRRVQSQSLPPAIAELVTPPPLPPAEMASRLVVLVQSQRGEADTYPVLKTRLLQLAAAAKLTGDIKRALANVAFKTQLASLTTNQGECYALVNDLSEIAPRLMVSGVTQAQRKIANTTAFKSAEIAKAVVSAAALRKTLAAAMEASADRSALPPEIGWLKLRGVRLYFLHTAVEPRCEMKASVPNALVTSEPPKATPIGDFRPAFEAAFDRVDARQGKFNFVKLHELRTELAGVGREAFDAGLRELRLAGLFTLDSSEGGAVQLTQAEREAGIREGSSLLVYASRK